MLDQLFDFSNELGELVLAEEAVPEDLIRRVLREATLHRSRSCRCCAARRLTTSACSRVLDAVADYLPSPADKPPVEGSTPKSRT